MVKFYPSIPPSLQTWALAQPLFFTASAPLSGSHVNLSPKGLPAATFSIFGPNSAAYIDTNGSGSETIAHIYENGRVTVMFCSFGPSPRIMRFFCWGRVVEWDEGEFGRVVGRMGKEAVKGARAVVVLDVWKVQTSCGFGVPLLGPQASLLPGEGEFEGPLRVLQTDLGDRKIMGEWADYMIEHNKLRDYQAKWNSGSLDGLPGLKAARRDQGEVLWVGDLKARIRRLAGQREAMLVGVVIGMVIFGVLQALIFRERKS